MSNSKEVSLCAVGDVMINREAQPEFPFHMVQPIFDAADIVFGNCEGVYVSSLERAPSCIVPSQADPRNAPGLGAAGFDVMACANNHFIDGSYAGMFETLDHLRDQGIATLGAGANLAEARAPVVLERNGLRVGFLAYCSVFPAGYDATTTMPGIAPMRAQTLYAPPATRYYSPGEDADVLTVPFAEDLEELERDLSLLRERADVIVTSFHWGLFSKGVVITDYERAYGHAAVDFGADLVLGHHHHTLRGIERYRGKPIVYGLGHFVFDQPNFDTAIHRDGVIGEIAASRAERDGAQAINPEPEYPLLPFGPDGRMTMLVRCELASTGLTDASFVPCLLEPSGAVRPLDPESDEGKRVIAFIRESSDAAGLQLRIDDQDGPVIAGHRGVRIL